MCRIEERVYVAADGSRQTFEDPFYCDRARRGKLCSNVQRKVTEYLSQPPSISRDDASSPASYNPPTPTGTYLTERRQPSGGNAPRSSTRDERRKITPEVVIAFGKKKYKKYPERSSKRSSLGAGSVASSNEVHIDTLGSDAEFTVATGFPEAHVQPTQPYSSSSHGYTTITAVPQGHPTRHRQTSSGSSFTTSSQPPSLYATSEPDSPSRRPARYPPTIVHNPPPMAPPSPTTNRTRAPSSPSYRIVTPTDAAPRDNVGADGLSPLNYTEFLPSAFSSNSNSSRDSVPRDTARDTDRAPRRKGKEDAERKRQETNDRELAQALAKEEEEKKQVRFELGRHKDRENQRAEKRLAESERRRAEERESERQRKQRERERQDLADRAAKDKAAKQAREAREAKERADREAKEKAAREAKRAKEAKAAKAERDRLNEDVARRQKQADEARASDRRDNRPPPTRNPSRRYSHSRRPSVSHDRPNISQEYGERERAMLLADTRAEMAREREAAEQREREERTAILRQQQQTSQYYNPRAGPTDVPSTGRRPSSSRRNSISNPAPPMMGGLSRSNSRRVSIHQAAPPANLPPLNTTVNAPMSNPYATRPASSHQNQPPLFSPNRSGYQQGPPSARYPVYGQPPPQPTYDYHQPSTGREHWDMQELEDRLSHHVLDDTARFRRDEAPRRRRDEEPTIRRRGQDVLQQAARQATGKLSKAVGYEDDYEDSDSENDEDRAAGYGPRLGLGKGKRRN